ncbi:MAG: MATE family efflux transporter, partial [Clostridiales bacterium]|nr:MATE family efflux transporter [Clostridiales bacterium]
SGLAGGSIVLISQYWGRQDKARIKQVYAVIAALCLAVSAVLIVVIQLFPHAILSLVVNPNETEITALAMQYLPIVCLSYLPFAVTASVIGMLKGVEVVRVTIYLTATSLVSNVGLNYILIFGKLGFPAMGVQGAAIATVLARVIEAALV